MTSEEERPIGKIRYEKPTAVDLGPTAPIVGASCVAGTRFDQDACDPVGNAADLICTITGNSAVNGCLHGPNAVDDCRNGVGFTF